MNPQLAQAAAQFEAAKDRKGYPPKVPFERLTKEMWEFIESELPNCYPDWFKELTSTYRLLGGHVFLQIDPDDPLGPGVFSLLRPSEWMANVSGGYNEDLLKLSKIGFVPFADGEDGNLWVFRKNDGDDPQIYFMHAGLWLGDDTLTQDNGLYATQKTFSEFLIYCANWNTDEDE